MVAKYQIIFMKSCFEHNCCHLAAEQDIRHEVKLVLDNDTATFGNVAAVVWQPGSESRHLKRIGILRDASQLRTSSLCLLLFGFPTSKRFQTKSF